MADGPIGTLGQLVRNPVEEEPKPDQENVIIQLPNTAALIVMAWQPYQPLNVDLVTKRFALPAPSMQDKEK